MIDEGDCSHKKARQLGTCCCDFTAENVIDVICKSGRKIVGIESKLAEKLVKYISDIEKQMVNTKSLVHTIDKFYILVDRKTKVSSENIETLRRKVGKDVEVQYGEVRCS